MEAPEKIYLNKHPFTGELHNKWLLNKWDDSDIDYIRTDAFIEKATEWLKENKYHPFIGCEDCCLSGFLTDEFIEEFRKVMKGE